MKALILTREYPPHVYGGAGVHVEHLTRELARRIQVEVRDFASPPHGAPPLQVRGFSGWAEGLAAADPRHRKALEPLSVNLAMAATPTDADVVHCHTWYALMAGVWLRTLQGLPLVATTHSLEPHRPWKAEQLGEGGYRLSSWIEAVGLRTADAVIAVSETMRRDVLSAYDLDPARVHVIHNGVDVDVFRPRDPGPALARLGIDPARPYLLFVGRITRQKGVLHLLAALKHVDPDLPVVLCAGAPDTPEIGREMEAAVAAVKAAGRRDVHWVAEQLPVDELVQVYSGAELFVCPSVYEPFGIINLEAMGTARPVVASRVGGIPEVVVDGETGLLVPFEARPAPDYEPRDPEGFAHDLAEAINRVHRMPEAQRRALGEAGRRRAVEAFSWGRIATETVQLYGGLVGPPRA